MHTGTTGMAKTGRRAVEIEKLLHWAYRDELSKRMTSSAEGIWDRIREFGDKGGIYTGQPSHGGAQRYAQFGLPHPDAETIERAVSALENATIDWRSEGRKILGLYLSLIDPAGAPGEEEPWRITEISWNNGRHRERQCMPRRTITVKTLNTAALVTMHARMGTRPDWRSKHPEPGPTPAPKGPNAAIVGECRGKNIYSFGSHCPVRWSPSPMSIAEARADYLAWWRGLKRLSESLLLTSFEALPPLCLEMPWRARREPIDFGGKTLTIAASC